MIAFFILYIKIFEKHFVERCFFVYNNHMRRKFLGPIFLGLMICLSLALVGIGGFFLAGCTKEKDAGVGQNANVTITLRTTQIGGASAPALVYYSVATSINGSYSSETTISNPNGQTFTITSGYTLRFRPYYSNTPYSEIAFVTSNCDTYEETQLLHPGMTSIYYSSFVYVEDIESDTTLTIYSVKRMNRIKLDLAGASYDDYQAYTGSTYSGVKFTEINTKFAAKYDYLTAFALPKRGGTYWDGWFRSENHENISLKREHDNAVTMKMTFVVPTTMTLNFQYFVQSEEGYDRAYFSKLDTAFTYPDDYNPEPTATYQACLESDDGTYGTVSYTNVSAGTHTIYVKYQKDGGYSCGADGICFRPLFNYVYGTSADDVVFCYPQSSESQFSYFRLGRLSKSGHDFAGWYTVAAGGGQQRAGASGANLAISTYSGYDYYQSAPLTWYAYFTPAVIGITLEQSAASTTGTSAVYYRYGTNAYYSNSTLTTQISSITTPWKYGHYFNGFFTQPNGAGTQYINGSGGFTNSLYSYDGSGGTTLYAYFDPKYYAADFYPMGATTFTTSGMAQGSSYSSFTAYCGTAYRISDYVTAISRTGYTFDGWLITSYSSGEYARVGASTSSMFEYLDEEVPNDYYFQDLRPSDNHEAIFEAQWTANHYNVTADANGGSFSNVPSGWSGSGSTRTKSIEYGGQYGDLPTVTKSNYTFDGWHMTNTSGATISSATTMNTASAHTLMAKWNATPRTITITAYTYSYTGTGANGLPSGASLGISYKKVLNGEVSNVNVTQTIASDSYAMHQGTSCSVTPVVPEGYVFAGLMRDSVNGVNYDYSFSVPNSDTTYYAVFQEAKVKLQYDAGELYYYYEDGYYPQSYVGNDLNTTLNNASSPALASAGWSINVGYSTLNVYSYFGNYYVKVQAPRTMTISLGSGSHFSGTSYSFTSNAWYWFKVEPIRWRVSDYGGSPAQLLADGYWWKPGQAFYNIVGISDILGYDRLSSQPSNFVPGDNATEGNIVQSQTYGAGFGFALGTGESASSMVTLDSDLDIFNSTGNATKVLQTSFAWDQRASSNDKLIAASLRDIDKVTQNLTMYASDFSAFMMGCDFDKATGWTRNLYNLGSYYAIAPGGTRTEAWCDQYYGYVFAHQAYQVVRTD